MAARSVAKAPRDKGRLSPSRCHCSTARAFSIGDRTGTAISQNFQPLTEPMTKLLIIEDDEQTRENLELILHMEGYAVRSAGNGREGLSLVQAERPELIICDVSMPAMDGHEVL